MHAASIIGTGIALPKAQISSAELDARLGQNDGWLEAACGVQSRSVVSDDESQEGLALVAADLALKDANLQPDEVDLILFGAAVGRQPIPATAPLIKGMLGIARDDVAAFDVNATCLSTLVAMDTAALHIQSGRAKNVLVVGSEIASRALPWDTDPSTAGLFGDGAGAIVMSNTSRENALGIGEFGMQTWAEGYEHCQLAAGGTRFDYATDREEFERHAIFQMKGHELFKLSRKRLPDFVDGLLRQAGWSVQDVDLVVPHQASPLALEHMIRRCGFAPERVFSTVRETGNLVAASLPITLHSARKAGRILPGTKVLMIGTSAGVSVAGLTLVGT